MDIIVKSPSNPLSFNTPRFYDIRFAHCLSENGARLCPEDQAQQWPSTDRVHPNLSYWILDLVGLDLAPGFRFQSTFPAILHPPSSRFPICPCGRPPPPICFLSRNKPNTPNLCTYSQTFPNPTNRHGTDRPGAAHPVNTACPAPGAFRSRILHLASALFRLSKNTWEEDPPPLENLELG